MSRTRSLRVLFLCLVFCAGLAFAASAPGVDALPARGHLNPPTALWKAYPLQQSHVATGRPAANKPIITGPSQAGVTRSSHAGTNPTETQPTAVHGNQVASRPTSGNSGVPIVLVMSGLIGLLLASALLFVPHALPAKVVALRRDRGPIKTKPPSRSERTGRPPVRARTRKKPSRPKQPSSETPTRVEQLPRGQRAPDERETTDDLLEALRPALEPAEESRPAEVRSDLERVSALESHGRPMKPVEAASRAPHAGRQAPEQRREVVGAQFCETKLWRGYVKCHFYVELEGSAGAIAESPLFRLRNSTTPDERAQRALSDLIADLERVGWSVVETGPVWYSRRLQRPTRT